MIFFARPSGTTICFTSSSVNFMNSRPSIKLSVTFHVVIQNSLQDSSTADLQIFRSTHSVYFGPEAKDKMMTLCQQLPLLIGDMVLLPIHHFMLRYPQQIESLGPWVLSWTMRHESKLSFVKEFLLSTYSG